MLTFDFQQKTLQSLLKKSQNAACSDCNGKYPCWASLDFGVFICMDCSGAHRALGQSVTRVKSVKLDTWHKDWVENMKIGNSILNQYWEANVDSFEKLKPSATIEERKRYVVQKYVKKRFAIENEADPLTKYKQTGNLPIYSNKIKSKQDVSKNNKKQQTSNKNINPQTFSLRDFAQMQIPTKITNSNEKVKNQAKIKQQTNLLDLSLTNQNVKSSKKAFNQFNFFQLGQSAKKQQKIDKSNFNSFSGIKASHSSTGNFEFDEMLAGKLNNKNKFFNQPNSIKKTNVSNANIFETGNFHCFNQNANKNFKDNKLNDVNQFSTGVYNKNIYTTFIPHNSFNNFNMNTTQVNFENMTESKNFNNGFNHQNMSNMKPNSSIPHQTTHVTMNINMNMYPNVMNINFSSENVNHQHRHISSKPIYQTQISDINKNNNISFNQEFLTSNYDLNSNTVKGEINKNGNNKPQITLQITDHNKKFQKLQNSQKSWVDDWK